GPSCCGTGCGERGAWPAPTVPSASLGGAVLDRRIEGQRGLPIGHVDVVLVGLAVVVLVRALELAALVVRLQLRELPVVALDDDAVGGKAPARGRQLPLDRRVVGL